MFKLVCCLDWFYEKCTTKYGEHSRRLKDDKTNTKGIEIFSSPKFFLIPGDEKNSRWILIPGLLVSRDQKKWYFDPWDDKSLVLRLCGVFLFDFLGRHIDMSYYYSSVFLFLKNFLVFFFFFSFASLFFEQVWSEQRGGGLFQTFLAFFVESFDSFFQAEFTLVTPRLGMNAKMEGRFLAKWASWTPQCGHETICE